PSGQAKRRRTCLNPANASPPAVHRHRRPFARPRRGNERCARPLPRFRLASSNSSTRANAGRSLPVETEEAKERVRFFNLLVAKLLDRGAKSGRTPTIAFSRLWVGRHSFRSQPGLLDR